MTEHRRSYRIAFDSLVEFTSTDCRHICELIDISLQGALIAACSGATPDTGTPCQLKISLDDSAEIQIIMNGTVAHKIENRVGIHCESIDSDSMAHLRKLIEYNLGDVELVNRDFETLIHEHNKSLTTCNSHIID
ncbi:MAG: PilZ domain-containing protein [Gammaproteobacteria bacterium]|nr:PilZ domain-containing protein [Gammaproteobacteria bacterium]